MKYTRRIFGILAAVCLAIGLFALAACRKDEDPTPEPMPEPETIEYTVTVACEDTDVLANVKVQLLAGSTPATAETPLDSAHKATFELEPADYTVKLSGVDGYTYPATTLTKDAPAATVTLTATAIEYSVTVACEDEDVLANVKVQLLEGSMAATAETPLDSAHKATFELEPADYTVKLSGADGYTYPATTLTKSSPAATVTLSPLFAAAYALGGYRGEVPNGVTPPAGVEKTEGETFALAGAPVWSGHTFRGWTDGETTYAAGASYTMPAHAVTLTALWNDLPKGEVRDENVTLPEWNEGETEGGYTIKKGEYIEVSAKVRYKETDDSSHGILVKIFPDSKVDNNYFYQCRCDFIIKRNNWNWNENNDGFTVTGEGWDRDTYKNCSDGTISIRVALDEGGTLTYTFEFTAGEYSGDYHHRRVFTDQTKMDSAVVLLGTEKCQIEETALTYPFAGAHELTLDFGENWESGENTVGGRYEAHHFTAGETFTFPEDPFLYPYEFVGWQKEGESELYGAGDTFEVGDTDATFVAVWRQSPTITIDRNGGGGDSVTYPTKTYDEETGKYVISGLPNPSLRFTTSNRGYTFAGWETTVDGETIEVDGPFSVDPGAKIVFKALWTKN